MRNIIFSLMSLALVLGLNIDTKAQRGFSDYGREQDIFIQYRWRASNIFERHANAALILRLTNETQTPAEVSFTISFYREKQVMFRSEDNKICLLPGQSLRGAPADLRFMAEGISLDMVQSDWFRWDISQMQVTPVESCR